MKKEKLVSLVLAMSIGLASLTGCTETTYVQEQVKEEVVEDITTETYATIVNNSSSIINEEFNIVDEYEVCPDEKVFEPGKHVFMVRYRIESGFSQREFLEGLSVVIPDGYEILEFENYTSYDIKGTQETYGFDVWFINTEPVLVKQKKNRILDVYDYSQPGILIKKEVTNEYVPSK